MRSRIAQGFGVSILGLCLTLAAAGTSPAQQCIGDCNADGRVTIDELVLNVNIALDGRLPGECPNSECPDNLGVHVTCLVEMVNNALNGCPDTPRATPTPTTPVPITYRLTDGSTILFMPPTPVGAAPPVPQPLSGTFTVVRNYLDPNVFFASNITRIDFGSEGFTVTTPVIGGDTARLGCLGQVGFGCIEASTLYPPPTAFYALVSVNEGVSFELSGAGPLDSAHHPPTFSDLELSAGPYHLTLFAVPDN